MSGQGNLSSLLAAVGHLHVNLRPQRRSLVTLPTILLSAQRHVIVLYLFNVETVTSRQLTSHYTPNCTIPNLTEIFNL